MSNGNMPINPIVNGHGSAKLKMDANPSEMTGLTKREYFAGLAMQGFIAGAMTNDEIAGIRYADTARTAISFADALLEELDETNQPTPKNNT